MQQRNPIKLLNQLYRLFARIIISKRKLDHFLLKNKEAFFLSISIYLYTTNATVFGLHASSRYISIRRSVSQGDMTSPNQHFLVSSVVDYVDKYIQCVRKVTDKFYDY